MMGQWYSVRMRSAQGGPHEAGGIHISGGEGLWAPEEVQGAVQQLLQRAMDHERGEADFIQITVEKVQEERLQRIPPLAMTTYEEADLAQGRARALELLIASGVSQEAARRGLQLLAEGPGPGGTVMRGAILMDGATGERLEEDQARGVRVSRLGWQREALEGWRQAHGIGEQGKLRIADAVAIASKVAAHPLTIAELCWSDDPGYITGYVASQKLGYCRITPLKGAGNPLGGRVFFVRPGNLADFVTYLEEGPVQLG